MTRPFPGAGAGRPGRGRTRQRQDGMNKTEARFASEVLTPLLHAGTITRWDYQPERLVLAKNTQYTPDFRVLLANGIVRFYEVKGFWEDDARVKLKLVAELHPYEFVAVRWGKPPTGGPAQWMYEPVAP